VDCKQKLQIHTEQATSCVECVAPGKQFCHWTCRLLYLVSSSNMANFARFFQKNPLYISQGKFCSHCQQSAKFHPKKITNLWCQSIKESLIHVPSLLCKQCSLFLIIFWHQLKLIRELTAPNSTR
jgi:hypothetical protein